MEKTMKPWEEYQSEAKPWEEYQPAKVEKPKESGFIDSLSIKNVPENAKNLAAGLVRGAGSIGSTILAANDLLPIPMAMNAIRGEELNPMNRDAARREGMDAGLAQMGADTNSGGYQVGKVASEIAGTAGAGNVIAPIATAAKMPMLANSIRSGGMSIGTPSQSVIKNFLTRVAGGGISGGAMVGAANPQDAGTGAAIGAALPVAVAGAGKVGSAIYNAVSPNVAPEVVKLAEKAKNLGIDIPADRLANSKPLNAVASSLNYVPFSGRAATEQKFESQLNKALSKTFGQNSDNVTMALRKASAELGQKFDATLKSNVVKVDSQFIDDIVKTQNEAANDLVGESLQRIDKQIENLASKANNGVIDGQAAYNIKKTLDRIGSGNTNEAYHARQLKKDLMNALDRSLGDDGAKAFAEVRKHYGTMLDLEGLAQNGAEGGISVARLANMKNIKNSELQDLADIAAQFLKPREGQHGAMQRAMVGGGAAAFGGIPTLVGGAAVGRGINSALNSNVAKKAALGQLTKPALTQTNSKLINASRPLLVKAYNAE